MKKSKSLFIKNVITSPRTMGAIVPSSARLAESLVLYSNIENSSVVVELGTGTGVITREILKKLPFGVTFFALELNKEMFDATLKTCPEAVVFNDCASNVGHYLLRFGVEKCDRIISSLPWSSFDSHLQEKLLSAAVRSLAKDGVFVTYAYVGTTLMPSGRRMRRMMSSLFSTVEISEITWGNLPPAYIYRCRL